MIQRILIRTVETCARSAATLAAVALVAAIGLGIYVSGNLGVDTDTNRLFPRDLAWRQRDITFDKAFPQTVDRSVVVIDALTPARAEEAAARLADRLSRRGDAISSVSRPDEAGFFRRNGLLFLSPEELTDLTTRVAEIQPLLGTLSNDPTVPGFFKLLGDAADAVDRKDIPAASVAEPFESVAAVLQGAASGSIRPLSWRELLTGRKPGTDDRRSFILYQPVLDYGALAPGEKASHAIREAARSLGITPENGFRVRLTGTVPLSDEEFATVAEGTGRAIVASFTLVALLLLMAVRSPRLVGCILAVLLMGIITTCAFAAAAVHVLNIISIAFIVLFIGIAVDFGIQFTIRFLDERMRAADIYEALRATAASTGRSLAVAAAVCTVGFLSLVPTDYAGMGELGLISGAGMVIALVLNLTLLPALLVLVRPAGQKSGPGFAWAAPVDRWLIRHRRATLLAALIAVVAGVAMIPRLRFDSDPLHLKDPRTESVSTLYDLMGSPSATPLTIDVLEPDLAGATRLSKRLAALPEVDKAINLQSFVPDDQEDKLDIIDQLSLLTGPIRPVKLSPGPADPGRALEALQSAVRRLSAVPEASPLHVPATHIAAALQSLAPHLGKELPDLKDALLGDLPYELDSLRQGLQAETVTADTLPPSLRREWVAPDGEARIQVLPKADIRDLHAREAFARAVRGVAPNASGAVISSLESGHTVVGAFVKAGILALLSIVVLLGIVLRRVRDTALVLAPLLIAGTVTVATCVFAGLRLNFANIIALPLILGIGVSFSIYFVINWRQGMAFPLQSPTARAVLFSALTTGVAFGSLMLSTHPGTVSMGLLLSIALACTLACTLFVLPALLGPPPGQR